MDADEPAELDFFVSYTGVNEPWARWITVELERAGYKAFAQMLDIRPGHDFVHEMQQAAIKARRTIAVISPAYAGSKFGEAEWRAAFAPDPSGELRKLIPVQVQPGRAQGLLQTRVAIELFDVDEHAARQRLLDGVGEAGPRPTTAPFPGAAPQSTTASTRFPGDGPAVSNLPPRNRSFTGRDSLLEDLHSRLQAAQLAAVLPMEAVHGLGGVGKTELVNEFAHRYRADYDTIWWIPAEQPTSTVAALTALATRLGVTEATDQTAVIEALFELLRGRERWLLIYDNAEHPRELAGLLPPAGVGSVLVTSRWTAWDQRVEPLRVDVLAREESVDFLTARTGSEDNGRLGELAEMLGDLPLAMEEAAAYLRETQVALGEFISLVEHRARELFDLALEERLATGRENDRKRIATIWSLTLDRIREETPEAESILILCSFLSSDIPRSLPREAEIPASLTDPLVYNNALRSLGRYSMVDLSPEAIKVHRLVQTVVRAQLPSEAEHEWAVRAVSLLCASFPSASGEATEMHRCALLLPHLLTACGHAEPLGVATEEIVYLLDRASLYLRTRGQYQQALPLAERAITLLENAHGASNPEMAARRDELAMVLVHLGENRRAYTEARLALQIAEENFGKDDPATVYYHNSFGSVLHELGNPRRALIHHRKAVELELTKAEPDYNAVALSSANLGTDLLSIGDTQAARRELGEALRIGEDAVGPSHPSLAAVHNNLAQVLRRTGELDDALYHIRSSLDISLSVLPPDHPNIGLQRLNLGTLLRSLDHPEQARTELEQALRISEDSLGPDHPQTQRARSELYK
jgi:tetratricopeptide (TPR) repeat protein